MWWSRRGAYWFLKLVADVQGWVYIDLPKGLGFHGAPPWWALLPLAVAGVIVGLTIRYLPGRGGHSPADGFKASGVALPAELPGIFLAALVLLMALAGVLGFLDRVEAFAAGQAGGEAAAEVVAVARQVRDQDVDCSGPAPALRRGVARDRRISIEDGQMRHGRKSRSVLFDGYKRHVLTDLDTDLVTAVGITLGITQSGGWRADARFADLTRRVLGGECPEERESHDRFKWPSGEAGLASVPADTDGWQGQPYDAGVGLRAACDAASASGRCPEHSDHLDGRRGPGPAIDVRR